MNPILKRTLTGSAIGAVVIAAIVFAPVWCFQPVVGVLILLALIEYVQLLRLKVRGAVARFVWFLLGAAIITAGLWALPTIAERRGNLVLLYVIAIVKFSDVGGFAFGLSSAKLMPGGNHKLCPSISPGKSWEGLFGSVVFSSLVSLSFAGVTHFGVAKSISMGVAAALLGTFGDLIESRFKRWVGVKDSSTMAFTNGLGGFLDMFDSLLVAPAVLAYFL